MLTWTDSGEADVQAMDKYASQRGLGQDSLLTLRHMMAKQLARCTGTSQCPSPAAPASEQSLFYGEGPFWDRSFHKWAARGGSASACAQVQQVLDAVGAGQVVVGHSIQVSSACAQLVRACSYFSVI